VEGNPLRSIDPTGLCLEDACVVEGTLAFCARFPNACINAARAVGAGIGSGVCALTGMCNESTEDVESCPTPENNPDDFDKLRGDQGYRPKDKKNERWKKDKLHKDHWDVSDTKGKKIKEIDFDGNQIWPGGSKNKNKL
jgi:hypothetical protein